MVGFGYDLHILVGNSPLIIGGIEIESDFGAVSHSDGDVLIHSLIDAILGAMGEGDIGELFPDTNPDYKGISSSILLKKVIDLMNEKNYSIVNIDCTIVLEKPKLGKYKQAIRKNIARLCKISEDKINIKAKTNEKQDSVGNSKAIVCYSICQLEKIK